MMLTEQMSDVLDEVRRIEGGRVSRILSVPVGELGNRLIDVYYISSSLATRELIKDFMNQAGVVWMRKLLTRDTSPIASTATQFATLNDYMSLLVANDESLLQASRAS